MSFSKLISTISIAQGDHYDHNEATSYTENYGYQQKEAKPFAQNEQIA